MTDWQDISTAPKDKPILAIGVYDVSGGVAYETGVVKWCKVEDGWFYQNDGNMAIEVEGDFYTDYYEMAICTHWMPLPEPPK